MFRNTKSYRQMNFLLFHFPVHLQSIFPRLVWVIPSQCPFIQGARPGGRQTTFLHHASLWLPTPERGKSAHLPGTVFNSPRIVDFGIPCQGFFSVQKGKENATRPPLCITTVVRVILGRAVFLTGIPPFRPFQDSLLDAFLLHSYCIFEGWWRWEPLALTELSTKLEIELLEKSGPSKV